MTREEFVDFHSKFFADAIDLMKRKNADYSPGADPFRNFRRYGAYGVLVRMGDKLARLESFVERGSFAVDDEKIEDTCRDIANYAGILLALVVEAKAGK